MNSFMFVKSFSKGQITIPKAIRDQFGIVDEFWLKLTVDDKKIIAEPIREEKKLNPQNYLKVLKSINTRVDLEPEILKSRAETEERLKKYGL